MLISFGAGSATGALVAAGALVGAGVAGAAHPATTSTASTTRNAIASARLVFTFLLLEIVLARISAASGLMINTVFACRVNHRMKVFGFGVVHDRASRENESAVSRDVV